MQVGDEDIQVGSAARHRSDNAAATRDIDQVPPSRVVAHGYSQGCVNGSSKRSRRPAFAITISVPMLCRTAAAAGP